MVDFVLKKSSSPAPPKLPVFVEGFAPHTPRRRLLPPAPDAFGLDPPSQLVLEYHWLAFLNQVHKNQVPISMLTTVEYKIDHI